MSKGYWIAFGIIVILVATSFLVKVTGADGTTKVTLFNKYVLGK